MTRSTIVYPAAHGDGGHAIRHHPPAAPPLWTIYGCLTTPAPRSLIEDLFCATREAVFHALIEPPIVEPTLAKITERLGESDQRILAALAREMERREANLILMDPLGDTAP